MRDTVVALLAFLSFVLPAQVAWPSSRPPDKTIPFRLGGLVIGQRLVHFRERFPGAACGTVKRFPINRHTLDDPDGSSYLTCCVDDPNYLTKFSEFKVVGVEDQCPVLIGFWREKLVAVAFTVEVCSIEKLLPSFEKVYGQAEQTMHGRATFRDHLEQDAPLSLASWWYGDAHLALSIAILNAANGHAQERRLVQVNMWIVIDPRFSYW